MSIVFILTTFLSGNIVKAAHYKDVSSSDWFYKYVEYLSSTGILDSTQQNYRPEDNGSRAEALKLLIESAHLPLNTTAGPTFQDVSPDIWYYPYIETAVKQGIIDKGTYLAGKFRPNDPVTREEFAKMMVNTFQMSTNREQGPDFLDVKLDRWSYRSIKILYNNLIVQGYPDRTFKPTKNLNRAEMAKILSVSINPIFRDTSLQDTQQKISLEYKVNLHSYPSDQHQQLITQLTATIKEKLRNLNINNPNILVASIRDDVYFNIELSAEQFSDKLSLLTERKHHLEFKEQRTQPDLEASDKAQIEAQSFIDQARTTGQFAEFGQKKQQENPDKVVYQESDFQYKDEIPKALADILFNLPVGEIYTQPLETQGEYSIDTTGNLVELKGFNAVQLLQKRDQERIKADTVTGAFIEEKTEPQVKYRRVFFSNADDPWQDTALDESHFIHAEVELNENNSPFILLQFDDEGAKLLEDITNRNIGKPLAIFVDGKFISAPIVNEKILGGKFSINGNYSIQEAQYFVKDLNTISTDLPIVLTNVSIK